MIPYNINYGFSRPLMNIPTYNQNIQPRSVSSNKNYFQPNNLYPNNFPNYQINPNFNRFTADRVQHRPFNNINFKNPNENLEYRNNQIININNQNNGQLLLNEIPKESNRNKDEQIQKLMKKIKDLKVENSKYKTELENQSKIKEEYEILKEKLDDINKKMKEKLEKENKGLGQKIKSKEDLSKGYINGQKEIEKGVLDETQKTLEKEITEHKENKPLNEDENKIEQNESIKENNKLKKENNDLRIQFEELQKKYEDLKIKDEKLKNRIKSNNIILLYSSPTLIGLNNIGATCFMNSTLQCLSQTKELTSYFLNEKNKKRIINNNIANNNKNDYQLSPVYYELLEKLWEIDREKSFSPNTFMNTVNNMNPLFKTGQAGDAKDFIIFVLEQLHKELKQPINNNNCNENQNLNQYDKNNAISYFFNDFKKDFSIISDLFFGINETTNECFNCKNIYNLKGMNSPICYNYGIFNCLIFPLEEVKNMKNNSMQNNYNQTNNIVTIYDCFNYNQKTELFTGQNRNYCNICKQLFDSNYCSKIYKSPNILILILNRGKGNMYDVKLDFSEEIDITQFVLRNDFSQIIYNLYGVITHIGQSGPNAHFVASCKSPIDDEWYRYNDAFVNQITNFQKEVIEFGTPYILFYQKNN